MTVLSLYGNPHTWKDGLYIEMGHGDWNFSLFTYFRKKITSFQLGFFASEITFLWRKSCTSISYRQRLQLTSTNIPSGYTYFLFSGDDKSQWQRWGTSAASELCEIWQWQEILLLTEQWTCLCAGYSKWDWFQCKPFMHGTVSCAFIITTWDGNKPCIF